MSFTTFQRGGEYNSLAVTLPSRFKAYSPTLSVSLVLFTSLRRLAPPKKSYLFKDGHRLFDRRVSLLSYLTILMTKSREGATRHLRMGFLVRWPCRVILTSIESSSRVIYKDGSRGPHQEDSDREWSGKVPFSTTVVFILSHRKSK